ncbi:MAG: type II toxin-antitoxin system prevent-host-death family antitoxin [Marivibrio sp.]|uniref:type II toxin-antitoxin system Phd/YefM family antitoxin n=1 Tax=Marivibrio sp. TaxID=2039719 RepID=UPI0032ED07A0
MKINMLEAKSRLSELARRAAEGEEIIIARAGDPYMRLVPYHAAAAAPRPLGQAPGRCEIAEDFDAPLEDAAGFEGGAVFPIGS